jgi:hypothetical protein
MFLTGVSIALAIRFSDDTQPPLNEPLQLLWYAENIAKSVVLGGGGAFVIWLLVLRYEGKSISLLEPGAKLAVVLTLGELVALLSAIVLLSSSYLNSASNNLQAAILILPQLSIYGIGVRWMNQRSWRIVVGSHALAEVCTCSPISMVIAGTIICRNFILDRREHHAQHWSHYFGMLLWLCAVVSLLG